MYCKNNSIKKNAISLLHYRQVDGFNVFTPVAYPSSLNSLIINIEQGGHHRELCDPLTGENR